MEGFAMSDTPRTDAEAWTPKKGAFPIVEADFARELERENSALRDVVAWIASQQDLFFAECSQAEEIVARCQAALGSVPARWGGFCHRSTCHAVTKRGECPGDLKVCEGQSGGASGDGSEIAMPLGFIRR
jgi:hypothetical protein